MIELETVKQLVSEAEEPTLTLYLSVDNAALENQSDSPAWHTWAKNRLRELESEAPPDQRDRWKQIRAQAESFLNSYVPDSKGLALFCTADKTTSYTLPVNIENASAFGKTWVMPLLWAIDEYEPYLIALVDQTEARFFLSYLGQIGFQDSLSVDWDIGEGPERTSLPSNHDAGRGGNMDDVQDRVDEHVTRMYRDVVTHLQKMADKHQVRRIVLGGNEQSAHHVQSLMPATMAEQVVAVLPVPMNSDVNAMIERIQPVALQYERLEEMRLVEQVIDFAKAGGRGALGRKDVMDALQMQRVETLVAPWPMEDDQFAADLVMQTFASRGKIELVHGEAAERLNQEGGLAARLYYAL